MSRTILITGFPGFAARYLVQHIHSREPDAKVLCVVLPDHMERARTLIEDWGEGAHIEILEGDTVALDLGLTGRQYMELRDTVTDVYHLDALWHTSANPKRLHKVNVQGTRNVVLCIRDIKNLQRFNHFSTAYVCGAREGVIMEEEFELPPRFLNAYEETQYLAEKEVRRLGNTVPVSIFRPSLIVGHSKTGQIDRLTGPYALIRPLLKLPVDIPLPMPGTGHAPLNLVPVDYVVEALYHISLQERAAGRTFHLIDPNPMASRRVFELIALAANKPLPRGSVPVFLTRLLMKIPGLERTMRPGMQILNDFNRWSLFNNLNTTELTRQGPYCPPFPEYIEPLIDYLKRTI